MIGRVSMKGKRVIIPDELKQQAIEQFHMIHMGIKKTRLLAKESVYCINMNSNIESAIKHCTVCL